MPKNKDLKRLTRSRMQKTGEAYTTARAQLIQKKTRSNTLPDFAKLAGMSDDAVRDKTGRSWAEWVRLLDAKSAASMPHRDIARLLHEAFGTPGWWAQMVTVGYERIRGLREIGQRRGGTYDANKSKTFSAPIAAVYRAFSVTRTRKSWLSGIDIRVRTSMPRKSMRIMWEDGTRVSVYFVAKGPKKTQVAIQHEGLSTKSAATRRKEYWTERLEALALLLEAGRS
ncbi:MAG TPA: hypothetical protein VEK15_16920 [Vicinamibacteria bacterium]|nr:hypothetical protein [Vicinamibacteria bacterium]